MVPWTSPISLLPTQASSKAHRIQGQGPGCSEKFGGTHLGLANKGAALAASRSTAWIRRASPWILQFTPNSSWTRNTHLTSKEKQCPCH